MKMVNYFATNGDPTPPQVMNSTAHDKEAEEASLQLSLQENRVAVSVAQAFACTARRAKIATGLTALVRAL